MSVNILPTFILIFLLVTIISCQDNIGKHYTNTWVVRVHGGPLIAKSVAFSHGSRIINKVGNLEDYYVLEHIGTDKRSKRSNGFKSWSLRHDNRVLYAEQQIARIRVKRSYPNFNDPLWPKQWYLENDGQTNGPAHFDHNVIPVWKNGSSGKGVVVSILDDGIDYKNPDLKKNYDPEASYDINDNDSDPTPRSTWNDENRHGTRCAGEVAAQANNSFCAVGVAYNSKIGGIRMLDGSVTDAVEASSLSWKPQHVDIYSSSWGPEDNGKTVDGPGVLAKKAFTDGITNGRNSLGSIFVWASGNGGTYQDNCNCDGYAVSIYTISISAATDTGTIPWYSEACSSTLATTYSSGSQAQSKIVTVDLHNGCTQSHTGTSAAAPLAAGLFALALEVNPKLTWRDLQYIVVITSKSNNLQTEDWSVNGLGRKVSNWFGYGIIDASALVSTARTWKTLPRQTIRHFKYKKGNVVIPANGKMVVSINVDNSDVRFLEHVKAIISLSHPRRSAISIELVSPSNTKSILFNRRNIDWSSRGFKKWPFMTTHCWGENPIGTWTLIIHNRHDKVGQLTLWKLVLFGTSSKPYDSYYRSCHSECDKSYGCTGGGPEHCRVCLHLKSRDGKCVKKCGKGQYANSTLKACLDCPIGCNECIGDRCKDCKPPYVNSNGKCVNSCPQGTYRYKTQNAFECAKCSKECATCANETHCISCPDAAYEHKGKCVTKCPLGTFSNYVNSIRICSSCHQRCSDCFASGPNSCRVCRDKFSLVVDKSKCVKSCPIGYYDTAYSGQHVCLACYRRCSSCFSPAVNACTSCKRGFSLHNSTCITNCPDGTYADKYTGECSSCHRSCRKCEGHKSTNCLSCNFGLYLQGRKCIAHCYNGYYADNRTMTCRSCDISCSQCSGLLGKSCSLCKLPQLYQYNHRCLMECPNGYYADNHENKCKSCSNNCFGCYNKSSCLSCFDRFNLHNGKCINSCPAGFTSDKGVCIPCHPSCSECNGERIDSCSSCKSKTAFFYKGFCVNRCPVSYYGNGTSQKCQRCHSSCITCSGDSHSNCTACPSGRFLQNGRCLSKCEGGLAANKDGICMDCKGEGCNECISNNLTMCTSCIDDYFNMDFKCMRKCPTGTYGDGISRHCLICHKNCKTCNNGGEKDCTSCILGYHLHKGSCINSCPKGTYELNDRCNKCLAGCTVCANKNICMNCESSLLLYNGTCLKSCPDSSYYVDGNRQCQLCNPTCETCSGGGSVDNCVSCVGNFSSVQLGICIPNDSCNGSTYFDGKLCKPCHDRCATCFDGYKNACLTCKDGYYLHAIEKTCIKSCPAGYHVTNNTKTCQQCPHSCSSCTINGTKTLICLHCANGFYNDSGNCVLKCSSGKYHDEKSKRCLQCSLNCKECLVNSSTCSACKNGNYLHNGRCVASCPTGMYADNGRCYSCSIGCTKCKDTNACLQCKRDYIPSNGKCLYPITNKCNNDSLTCSTCNVTNCAYCSLSKNGLCSSCLSPYVLYSGICLDHCPNGSYADHTNNCVKCDNSCSSCIGPNTTDCTQCSDSNPYLSDYKCNNKCSSGHFIRKLDNQCNRCHFSCKACTDSNEDDCISCAPGFYWLNTETEKRCVQKCPRGYYKRENRCDPCSNGCSSCYGNGSNQCVSCVHPLVNVAFSCMNSCPPNTFNDSGICSNCHPSCISCFGPGINDCKECPIGSFMMDGTCGSCPSGYFEDTKSSHCLRCDDTCETCDKVANQCLSCDDGMNLQNDSCVSTCSKGYYNVEGICMHCHPSCASCKGFAASNCLSCQDGWNLKNNTCEPFCPSGEYYDIHTKSCNECHRSCATCTDQQPSSCLSCLKGYLLEKHISKCYPCCSQTTALSCCDCNSTSTECSLITTSVTNTTSGTNNDNDDFGNTFKEENPVTLIIIAVSISVGVVACLIVIRFIRCRDKLHLHHGYNKLKPTDIGNHHIPSTNSHTTYIGYDEHDEINQV